MSQRRSDIKAKAEAILRRLGLSPTEAIRMFYTQITLRNGLPFEVALPNEETVRALEDSKAGQNLGRFNTVEELFESWTNEGDFPEVRKTPRQTKPTSFRRHVSYSLCSPDGTLRPS